MKTLPYNHPEIDWPHSLSTGRTVATSCEIAFDFNWTEIIGHNHPKFQGLHDLSQAVSQFARKCGKTPLLLLSDKADAAFDERVTDSKYIAIVNIKYFLESSKEYPDRAAPFFLYTMSKYGQISAASVEPVTPVKIQQLMRDLEVSLNGQSDVLIEVLNKGGSQLMLALFKAVVTGLEKSVNRGDLEALTDILSTPTASVIWDAATAAKRRAAIEEFDRLLREDANEQEFQPWFESNAWVLGTHCVRILDDRRINVSKIADLIVESYDGRADLIELKRPSLGFWKPKTDHDNYIPHSSLTKAIIQAQNYQFALERQINNNDTLERFRGVPIAKPSSLLIHGRSIGWNGKQFEAQRLLNAGFTNLNVMTYDQVLRRARILLGSDTTSRHISTFTP